MRNIARLFLLLLFFMPVSGQAQVRTTTQTAATYKYSEKFLNNPAVQSYVESITWRLVDKAKQKGATFSKPQIIVGSTSAIQSVSGTRRNYIGITRGMLNVILNEAELACVISHEIGHRILHLQPLHVGLKPVERSQILRNQEQEADEYGAILCSDAGYDPFALVNFLNRLAQLTASQVKTAVPAIYQTHSDFAGRVIYLRQFLEKKKLSPLPDRHFSDRYVDALKSIRNYRSHDAVNELLPDVRANLLSIRTKVKSYQDASKPLPVDQFLEIMSELSQVARQNNAAKLQPTVVGPGGGPPLFMKEVVSQDAPLWDDHDVQQEIDDILTMLARMGVGFIPVVGDAVDLYEFLSGVEFGSGRKLDFNDRVMTAVGLLAGSGKMWREVACGVGQTFKESQVIRLVGRNSISEGESALKQALRDGIYERAMSKSELIETQRTGLLRGGRGDIHYFGSSISDNAKKTQRRLGLEGDLWDVKVKFRFKNETEIIGPARVSPVNNKPGTGGGLEFTAEGPIEIDIVDVIQLRK